MIKKIPSCKAFIRDEWELDGHFDNEIPNESGIYAIAKSRWANSKLESDVIYVGKSKNLAKRLVTHPVFNISNALLESRDITMQIFFFRFSGNLSKLEQRFIRGYRPCCNFTYV